MKEVAKLVLIDKNEKYLLMYRSDHPTFGDDADLPGGTVEEGESLEEAVIREVFEETGVSIESPQEVYSGLEYSKHGTLKGLFVSRVDDRPEIVMSWEHSSYEWIDKADFLEKCKNANDSYMHMVYEVMGGRVV